MRDTLLIHETVTLFYVQILTHFVLHVFESAEGGKQIYCMCFNEDYMKSANDLVEYMYNSQYMCNSNISLPHVFLSWRLLSLYCRRKERSEFFPEWTPRDAHWTAGSHQGVFFLAVDQPVPLTATPPLRALGEGEGTFFLQGKLRGEHKEATFAFPVLSF